jgi:two-component system, LytTR family, sensor histidine kinase AlgZ
MSRRPARDTLSTMRAHSLAIRLAPARLPRELLVLYLIAPLVTTPVLSGNFFALGSADMLRELVVNCVAVLAMAPPIHGLYRRAVPRWIARCASLGGRLAVHAAVTGGVAAAIALAIHPLVGALIHHGPSATTWVLRVVTVTWVIVFPALVFQELRDRTAAAERQVHDEREAALRAQLEALQSRTHPHFLFNAINSVAGLIHEDPALAERTLERLADVLRYALHSAQRERVALSDELAAIEDYLEIQRARFGDRLRYAIDVEPGTEQVALPPLVLQPLIENAVLHGVAGQAGAGQVRLAVRRRGAQIAMVVDDDGPGWGGSAHAGSGTGLRDLEHRLALAYRGAAALTIRPGELGGAAVELVIPAAAAPETGP